MAFVFEPSVFHTDSSALASWASQFFALEPPWANTWFSDLDQHQLSVDRCVHIREVKALGEFASLPWLAYLDKSAKLYGYSAESLIASVCYATSRVPVLLPAYKVQDLTCFIPLHISKLLQVLPYYQIPNTPCVQVAVLEPFIIPYVEEWSQWVNNRRSSGSSVADVRPAVFSYAIADPSYFGVWLSSLDRSLV